MSIKYLQKKCKKRKKMGNIDLKCDKSLSSNKDKAENKASLEILVTVL